MLKRTCVFAIATGLFIAFANTAHADKISAWGKQLIVKSLKQDPQASKYRWTVKSVNGTSERLPDLVYQKVCGKKDWKVSFVASPNTWNGLMVSCVGECSLTQKGKQKSISSFRISGWTN